MARRTAFRIPATAVLALLALASGSCGEPADTGAASPAGSGAASRAEPPDEAVDVCALMPANEVQTIVGHPLAAGETSYTYVTSEATCRYRSTEMDLQAVEIRIEALTNPDVQIARVRDQLGGAENPVSGIGDQAFYSLGQLFVFTEDHQIAVMVGRLPGVDPEQSRRRLAETVISRL